MYLFAATAIAAALIAGGGAWQVQNWRYASIEKDRIEAQIEKERNDRKVIDFAAVGHESDKTRVRTVFVEIEKEVERVVKETFYVDRACINDDGMRLIDAALGTVPAAGVPAATLPGPVPTN